jgi:hypothetical protein
MTRKPARPNYDAIVDLHPPGDFPSLAYGLVKLTYRISSGTCLLIPAEPLFHDIRDPEIKPRLAPGSEFWPFKYQTDVVVRGAAHAPGGKPVTNMQVSVTVGKATKRIQVWGQRRITWAGRGKPVFGEPERFDRMPIIYENAYGGCDGRVPVSQSPLTVADIERLQSDHPGMYPRNPFGKGYIVLPDPVPGLQLPNLEDPDDLLTPERFVVGDPARWHRQPLPMGFGYTNPLMFPRFVYLGLDAWFTPPDDSSLAEVRQGWIPANYRQICGTKVDPTRSPPAPYYQEASLGLVFPPLASETPMVVRGMNPEQPELAFALPPTPRMAIEIEDQRQNLKTQLCNVLIEPFKNQVSVVYVVRTGKLPRVFIPGIHGYIPLSLIVENDAPIVYETPPTIRDRLKAAEAPKA